MEGIVQKWSELCKSGWYCVRLGGTCGGMGGIKQEWSRFGKRRWDIVVVGRIEQEWE